MLQMRLRRVLCGEGTRHILVKLNYDRETIESLSCKTHQLYHNRAYVDVETTHSPQSSNPVDLHSSADYKCFRFVEHLPENQELRHNMLQSSKIDGTIFYRPL